MHLRPQRGRANPAGAEPSARTRSFCGGVSGPSGWRRSSGPAGLSPSGGREQKSGQTSFYWFLEASQRTESGPEGPGRTRGGAPGTPPPRLRPRSDTLDASVFVVSTVVGSQAGVWAVEDAGLRPQTPQVVQPDLPGSWRVQRDSEPPNGLCSGCRLG